jgi:hypothetical protein
VLPELPVPPVPGAEAIAAFFGMWPSFHDAEIISFHLNRRATSNIRVHAWTVREDERGLWVVDREATIRFDFAGISNLQLEGEDADGQNVVDGIAIDLSPGGYRLQMEPCYGLFGEIVANQLSVRIESEGPPQG